MTERTGVTSINGSPLTLLGEAVKVGQAAPDFKVRTQFGPDSEINLASSKGKVRILNVVPSLDTGVCEKQTIHFNNAAASLGDDIEILTVSMDLPTAQGRFCGNQLEGAAKVKTGSDYVDKSFGRSYGILIKEWQVLGRGLFVIDRKNVVQYAEYAPKIEELPNMEKALEVAKGLV